MSRAPFEATPTDDRAADAELARAVAAGNVDAEEELCRRLLPRVRAWGLKHLRDESPALDLAQQVVLGVIEALREGRVEQLDHIGAFVLGACKNTLFAWRRGERRRAALLERYGPSLDAVAHLDDGAVDGRVLEECFGHLAPRAQTVLALTFFADRSADEIASELCISSGNVRVLRHRALEQLHDCMTGGA